MRQQFVWQSLLYFFLRGVADRIIFYIGKKLGLSRCCTGVLQPDAEESVQDGADQGRDQPQLRQGQHGQHQADADHRNVPHGLQPQGGLCFQIIGVNVHLDLICLRSRGDPMDRHGDVSFFAVVDYKFRPSGFFICCDLIRTTPARAVRAHRRCPPDPAAFCSPGRKSPRRAGPAGCNPPGSYPRSTDGQHHLGDGKPRAQSVNTGDEKPGVLEPAQHTQAKDHPGPQPRPPDKRGTLRRRQQAAQIVGGDGAQSRMGR